MPLDAKKNEATRFQEVVRCKSCATAMIWPQPLAADIAGFYELADYYTHGVSHIREVQITLFDRLLTKLAWWSDWPTPFDTSRMAEMLPQGARVCDLGCGHAGILKRFADKGCSVIGVDPDPTSREVAAKSGITVVEGTAEAPPALGQFDLVIMTHSLEHCLDPIRAITSAYRMTKPGGYFYCEVPNCGCLHFETLTACSEMFDSPRHLWFFTSDGLRRAIEGRGYVFDSWRYDGFTRHHSPSWRAWEMTIAQRLADRGLKGKRHTFLQSAWLWARSAFAPAHKKYDCVGVLAKKDPSPS